MSVRDDKVLADVGPGDGGKGQGTLATVVDAPITASMRGRASASAARRRLLHVGHFAFMRSVVQGLDPRESWERYFRVEGEATDQQTQWLFS